jgi:hypothetical protein
MFVPDAFEIGPIGLLFEAFGVQFLDHIIEETCKRDKPSRLHLDNAIGERSAEWAL